RIRIRPTQTLSQQRVALLQYPIELRADGVVARSNGNEKLVEVAAPARRPAFDELQVVGREDRDAHQPEEATCPRQWMAIDLDPVPSHSTDLGFHQLITVGFLDRDP